MNNDEVLNLLNQIAQGNDKAFNKLYDFYHSDFVRLVSRKVYNLHDAEDIVCKAFMNVIDNPLGYNNKCKFSSYFYTIVMRRYIDWLRAEPEFEELDENQVVDWSSLEDGLDVGLEKKEFNDAMRECVNKLPDAQRQAVELALFNEESYSVIAKLLIIPLGTVKTRVKYGYAKVAECLKRVMG